MANKVTTFLLACSGADLEILEKPECRIEQNKYIGIGATILSTAVLASLSGGYALFSVFHSRVASICFGLLWGVVIFNLDRYIVSSMRKPSIDEGLTFFQILMVKLKELARALPRLLLAIFISIVITNPLELKLFGKEIEAAIAENQIEDEIKIHKRASERFSEIPELEKRNETMEHEIKAKEQLVHNLQQQVYAELDGWGGTRRPGDGPVHKEKQRGLDRAKVELKDLQKSYEPVVEENKKRIALLKTRLEGLEGDTNESLKKGNDGLLKKLETLSQLKRDHISIAWAADFIVLLFVLLETAPIFVKLLSERGPYDEIYDTQELRVQSRQHRIRLEIEDSIRTKLLWNRHMRAHGLQGELELSRWTRDSLQTLASVELLNAQMEIAQSIVERWRQNELRRLKVPASKPMFSTNGNEQEQGYPTVTSPSRNGQGTSEPDREEDVKNTRELV